MEVIFLIKSGALDLVKHTIEREFSGVFFGRMIRTEDDVLVEARVYDERFKAFIKSDSVNIKGLEAIYERR